jgi:CBS domain-containing protein
MSRRVLSVHPEDPASAAASLMAKEQIRRLPVEQNGKVVGIVSLGDVALAPDFHMEASEALSDISLNIHRK